MYRQTAALLFLLTSAIRINRTWHDLIVSSPQLQRDLFFRSASFPGNLEKNETRFNALLLSVFPQWFKPFSSGSWDVLCKGLFSKSYEKNLKGAREVDRTFNAIQHPNASWRRMYPV